MPRGVYQGVEYESVKYDPTTERWRLLSANTGDEVVLDDEPELDELEVECERCGELKAYIYPVTAESRWLCSDCEEAVTHGNE